MRHFIYVDNKQGCYKVPNFWDKLKNNWSFFTPWKSLKIIVFGRRSVKWYAPYEEF